MRSSICARGQEDHPLDVKSRPAATYHFESGIYSVLLGLELRFQPHYPNVRIIPSLSIQP